MNIIELLQQDGIQPVDVSRGEFHSPCPFCGGDDRFSCWPDKVNSNGRFLGGRGVCRQCGFNGDAVAYLMKRRAMAFMQAVKALGIDPGPMPEHRTTGGRTWQPAAPGPAPGAAWQARARVFVDHCAGQLQRNSGAMAWLQHERGLSVETIHGAGLGWNPVDVYQSRESWGMAPEVSSKGKIKMVWMPAGLTIPLFDDAGQVVRIRTRRSEPGQSARYVVAPGSYMGAMIQWQDQRAVAILESELDGQLVQQECRDLIGVISLGSATTKPDELLHHRLKAAEKVLICLDNDSAGARTSWGHWRNYSGFKRWPPVAGKDPGEMFKAGVSIRAWIEAGL